MSNEFIARGRQRCQSRVNGKPEGWADRRQSVGKRPISSAYSKLWVDCRL